jgi:hypothetical protein
VARVPNAGASPRRRSVRVLAATALRCAVAALIAVGLAGCFEANSNGAAPAANVSGTGGANAGDDCGAGCSSGEPSRAGDRAEGARGLLDGSREQHEGAA